MTSRSFTLLALSGALSGCVVVDPGNPTGGTPGPDPAAPGGAETGRLVGMTEAHNRIRSGVSASPSLPPLGWSDELARAAQDYADELAASCRLVHSNSGYGENLASFGGQRATPEEVVNLWAGEAACWMFGRFLESDRCDRPCDACGHYTQLVWRDTTLVGCGVADCAGSGAHEEVWVCNYNPPGNFVGREPY